MDEGTIEMLKSFYLIDKLRTRFTEIMVFQQKFVLQR